MTSIVGIIIAVVFVLYGVWMQQSNVQKQKDATPSPASAISDIPAFEPNDEIEISPDAVSPTASSSSKPDSLPAPVVAPSADWQYPGSTVTSQDGVAVSYQTNDSGETVYDWYKNIFEQRQYNAKTLVKTRANDVFKGMLKGAKAGETISITIEQQSKSSITTITVSQN